MTAPKKSRTIVTISPMYLAKPDAAAYLSISESMLDTLVSSGELPRPRKLSTGRVAWLVNDLTEWGQARPVSDLLPPINSGYGRAGAPSSAAAVASASR